MINHTRKKGYTSEAVNKMHVGGENVEFPKGKYAWMVKIGEKGQFVIPKEARELFDLQPGSEILVLGDAERGIAILPKVKQSEVIAKIFSEIENGEREI